MASTTQFDVDGRAFPIVRAGQGEVEYLHKIPTEIWIEILSRALLPIPPDSPFIFDVFGLTTLPEKTGLYSLQQKRMELLVICKTLYPIIEQLLLTDVLLIGHDQLTRFSGRARTLMNDHIRRGNWTKCIHIYAKDSEREWPILQLDDLLSTCPNIVSLDIGWRITVKSYTSNGVYPDTRSLKHLIWKGSSFSWDTLGLISTHFPSLEQLGMFTCQQSNIYPDKAVTLKLLRHLILSWEPVQYLDLTKLVLPALQSLSMDIASTGEKHVGDLFIHHGSKVVELQLNESHSLLGVFSIPTNSRSFTDVFSSLKTFTFNPTIFFPILSSEATTIMPHQELTHLKLPFRWEYPGTRSWIRDHVRFFSSARFPNLRLVTAIPSEAKYEEEIKAFLSEVFPHTLIVVEIDRYGVFLP